MPERLAALLTLWPELVTAVGQTALMVSVCIGSAIVVGGPVGVVLFLTGPRQSLAHRGVHAVLGWLVNTVRSFPFIILLVALVPFTRIVAGT